MCTDKKRIRIINMFDSINNMTENNTAQSSAEFIKRFSTLAQRLADNGIIVHTARLEWGSFGSWILMVIKNHEAVRFTFDGRDSFIKVESSPLKNHSYPNQWEEIEIKGMDDRQNEAISYVESFALKRFSS